MAGTPPIPPQGPPGLTTPGMGPGFPPSQGEMDPMGPPPPPFSALPPIEPPEPEYVPPPPMSTGEIAEIEEYVKQSCKASAEYVAAKKLDWERFDKLYRDRMSFWDWFIPRSDDSEDTTQYLYHDSRQPRPAHLTDYVHSPKPLISTWASNLVTQILEGPDWAVVEPLQEDMAPGNEDYPTIFKLQQLLLQKLAEGRINNRLWTVAAGLGTFGSVYGKVFHYTHEYSRWVELESPEDPLIDEMGDPIEIPPEYKEVESEAGDYPIIEAIPLDKVLVDPKAKHNDIQRYRWIGHRVTKTYDEIEAAFQRGVYHANYEAFTDRWDRQGGTVPETDELHHDADADHLLGDDVTWIEAWEWHGKALMKGELKEIVVTILTDPATGPWEADPSDGIVVRALKGPVLKSGLRPFVCAHYTPQPGPFGTGLIEENEQLLWEISQLTGQFQDLVRITTNFAMSASPAAKKQIDANGGALTPGMVFEDNMDGQIAVRTIDMPSFHANEILSMIQMKQRELETKSAQSDLYQGQSKRDKTATEAQILEQRGQLPSQTRAYIFAHDFMSPALTLALEMLQEASPDDGRRLLVRNQQGIQEPVDISADELKGRYKVVCTLTRQDQHRIAMMQSIERVLQAIPGYLPMIQQQGADINLIEIFKRWIDLLGISGSDRIVHVYTPQEQLLIQENQNLQQQLMELQQMMGQAPGAPPPPGGGQQPPMPPEVGGNGGPVGPGPNDLNALMGQVQRMAQGPQQGFV